MKRLLLGLLLLCVMPALAQTEDCPAFVDVALNTASEMCGGLGRNIACYGNVQIEAAARETAEAVTFAAPGDTAALDAFGTLTLAPLSLNDETWGIALLSAQANLPDTMPGQNVIFVLFGDVSLTNATETAVEVSMQAGSSANVRLRPGTDAEIIATLTSGDSVTANGRLEDSSWVRIAVFGSSDQYGWVSAPLLNGDPSTLPVVDVDAPPPTQGQSFYFNTGIGDSSCAQAPDSGILVQSPQGAGRVQFTANGVEFSIGSTLYLTSGNGVMTVYVIEGSAMLTAQGTTQAVPAGTYAEIPLDETGQAPAAAPGFPQPYADDAMVTLPLVLLPQTIVAAEALPAETVQEAVDEVVAATTGFFPVEGAYSENWDWIEESSPGGVETIQITVVTPGESFIHSINASLTDVLNRIAPSTYQASGSGSLGPWELTLVFSSNTEFTCEYRRNGEVLANCTGSLISG